MAKPQTADCHYCGRNLSRPFITKDHVLAKINGGDDTRSNIVWADQVCNVLKSDAPYETFRDWIAGLEPDVLEELRAMSLDPIDWKMVRKFQRRFWKLFPKVKRSSEEVVQRKLERQQRLEEKRLKHKQRMDLQRAKKIQREMRRRENKLLKEEVWN